MNQENKNPQTEQHDINPIEEPKRIGRLARIGAGIAMAGAALAGGVAHESDGPAPVVEQSMQIDPVGASEEYVPEVAKEVVAAVSTGPEQQSSVDVATEPTNDALPVKESQELIQDSYREEVDPKPTTQPPQITEVPDVVAREASENTQPPMEIEISGVEAGQEYMNNIAADLTEKERAEKVMYIDGAQFNVSEDFQKQYGVSTIYNPVVTGKDTVGYMRVNPETGVVEGAVIDARHGVITAAQGQTDENKFTTLVREHVDNEPLNKGGDEDFYRIVADDEARTFVGQATGLTSQKGGGDTEEPVKGGPQPGDPEYGQDGPTKGGDSEEGVVEYELFPPNEEVNNEAMKKEGDVEYDNFPPIEDTATK